MSVQALWHLSSQETVWRSFLVPDADHSLIRVRALYSLISTGTEKLVASGQVPEELYEVMRVPYMEGTLALPVKYGYSLVGVVDQPGHINHGQTVHLLHPHQSVCWVRPEDCFLVPKMVPARRAILASNLETAVTAIWDAGVSLGDRVVVVGFGMIGALLARLLSGMPAVELWVVEKQEERRTLATALGFQAVPSEFKLPEVDFAFHTSASSGGAQQALEALGPEGTLVELSWYGRQHTTLQLGGSFHYGRKRIISSQVANLPPLRRPRWDFHRRKETVFSLLSDPAFDQHITHEIQPASTPDFFMHLRREQPPGLGYCIRY